MRAAHLTTLASVALLAVTTRQVLAQEAMYTAASTMPSPGATLIRQQFHVFQSGASPLAGSDVRETRTIQAETSVQHGLDTGWAVLVRGIVEQARDKTSAGSETDTEFSSLDVTFKHRFYMHNPGGVDTQRAAVLFGARVDAEDSANVDPHLGVVYTQVKGLHGINVELHYMLTTGDDEDTLDNTLGGEGKADALYYNFAYVYRIIPQVFTSDSTGAWYVTAELNGLYETNGDNEIRFSPGLMFEGRRWGFEIMAQLPLEHNLDHRPELDWALGVGVRFLF